MDGRRTPSHSSRSFYLAMHRGGGDSDPLRWALWPDGSKRSTLGRLEALRSRLPVEVGIEVRPHLPYASACAGAQ